MVLRHSSPRPGLSAALRGHGRAAAGHTKDRATLHGAAGPPGGPRLSRHTPRGSHGRTAGAGTVSWLCSKSGPPRAQLVRGLGQGPRRCGLALHTRGFKATGTRGAPCSPGSWARPPHSPDARPRRSPPDSTATRSQTPVPRHPGPPVTACRCAVAGGASRAPVPAPTAPPEMAVLTPASHTRAQRGPSPRGPFLPPQPLAGPETTQTEPAGLRPPPGFPLPAGGVTLMRGAPGCRWWHRSEQLSRPRASLPTASDPAARGRRTPPALHRRGAQGRGAMWVRPADQWP